MPSSPWYAHDSGSQPGNLFNGTFGPEKPILIRLRSAVSECIALRFVPEGGSDLPVFAL